MGDSTWSFCSPIACSVPCFHFDVLVWTRLDHQRLSLCLLQCVHVQSLSRVQLFCGPMDCSLPGSSVHGISTQEYWEWVPISSPGDLPNPGIEPCLLRRKVNTLPLSHLGKVSAYFTSTPLAPSSEFPISVNGTSLRLFAYVGTWE